MKLILYPHGGSGNHGCEAIIRSTFKILSGVSMVVFSMHPEQDYFVGLDALCKIEKERKIISKISIDYLKAFISYHIFNDKLAFEKLSLSPILKTINKDDCLLSIGGDNYCYGTPSYIYLVNRECRTKGVKTFLWGCSIEKSLITNEMLEDLKGYTKIIARESITYETLINKGLHNVLLFPDPAFLLNSIELPLPDSFKENQTVGINVSPLIINYETKNGIVMKNYIRLIRFIIESTNMQIALIPHVVMKNNDDCEPLKNLYEIFYSTGRILLIQEKKAEVLKGYISRCRFMVTARTHASIAAYSQEIPTLVVGYSVKSRGIAHDIFGTDQRYVVPVQSLQSETDLLQNFRWILDNENKIIAHYKQVMPNYISKLEQLKDKFLSFV